MQAASAMRATGQLSLALYYGCTLSSWMPLRYGHGIVPGHGITDLAEDLESRNSSISSQSAVFSRSRMIVRL